MRKLGIDYGSKRIGIALSDEAGMMAFPHSVIPSDAQSLKTIISLIETNSVDAVVIGHSVNKDGTDNKIQAAIEELITDLTLQVGIPVHLEPEQYTTQEAIRFQGRNDKTDASAATIILNSFLTRAK